ncbi:uncharacterized protein LOC110115859 [Dendrobium catenatum]|uniref:J domain-containing protein n=1 Tax=Dendrobium catenatum TaxID=906689 RepID=A0A2I0VA68_9ASPA|nr:uncharacterized protein LOC110115859 [Dendrobium catenatum]PKU60311.1 hypothetical protein MA16_Dca026058 [Dendrobium catenatum]
MEPSRSLFQEKKHWWMMNRKIVNKHIRDARSLIATQDPNAVSAAIGVLDGVLALSPRLEAALELKARSLLFLRRFREVADMLQEYIPSYRVCSAATGDESSSSLSSSGSGRVVWESREGAKLLPKCEDGDGGSRCFSLLDIKRKVIAGIHRACDREGQWRYHILGQACCHLGLLEDAMILLQTGRRLASASSRRQSTSHSDDTFSFSPFLPPFPSTNPKTNTNLMTSKSPSYFSESASTLLPHIKLLLRRRAAATSALDAGHPNEAARHFSKILETRRGTPHPFATSCLIGRAAAYRAAGRVAESIADCNRALALDPTSIPALLTRADLLESVRCLTDCLRDLDHLKLLYDTIIRDRKLPGPVWRPLNGEIRYRDVPSSLRALTARINGIRQRFAAGEGNNVDYYKLIGVRRGCSRSELERANLVLLLRHKPEKAGAFVDKLDFSDEDLDVDAVRDQARMSALILYRMLQKGYSCIMATIVEDEVVEKKRAVAAPPVYQGVFCRDMAAVGSMLSRGISVKYEGLSC